ncbi:MAG: hypothetical protein PVF91_11580 [Chromatiales bacterium]|jgi:hypothetical protein
MAFLVAYWIVPALFLLGCVVMVIANPGRGWRRAGAYALPAWLASFVLGTGAILDSRGSTSGLGFIVLPLVATGPGLLGFALGALHHRRRLAVARGVSAWPWSAGAALAALGLATAFAYQAYAWHEIRQINAGRDAEVERQRQAIRANEAKIGRLLAAHPGEEGRLIAEMVEGTDDRTLLIPLAGRPETPPEVLDRLVRHPDLGVALTALRDPDTPAESIAWLFDNHSYPDYFFSTMAAHPNTPVRILRELYAKRAQNTGIARGLARNPSTPPDVRERLDVGGKRPTGTP